MGELIDPVKSILVQLNIIMRVSPIPADILSERLDQRFKIETAPCKLINMSYLDVKNYVNQLLAQKERIGK